MWKYLKNRSFFFWGVSGITILGISAILFVIFYVWPNSKDERIACEKYGGHMEVVKVVSTGKTMLNVYGCVKQ